MSVSIVKLRAGLLAIVAAVAVVPSVAGSARANSGYPNTIARDEGVAHLKAGRYQTAEAYFLQAIREQPNDPMLHYYLANALVYLHQHPGAIVQYQACYRLDPYGPLSGYCRRALKTYGAAIPDGDTTGGATSVVVSPAATTTTIASRPSSNKDDPPPAEPPPDAKITGINGTINTIRAQAESEKSRHRAVSDSLSAAAIKSGEAQAASIQEAAKEEIERVLNPPPLLNGGRINPLIFNPDLQKARIEEIRHNAEEASSMARNKALDKANTYKKWSQVHDGLLDDSATSLEGQLHMRNLPGTPRLSHAGTGLFVRNYNSADQPYPYPEPHQSIARIHRVTSGPQSADENNQTELHARQEFDAGDRPGNTVRGTVVKKTPSP